MAAKGNFSLVFLVVSAIVMAMFLVLPAKALKETTMTVYFHDYSMGSNATSLPVVGFPGKIWSFGNFGTHFVTDDYITEGSEFTSAMVGRAQGNFIIASLDGLRAHSSFSLVFTNEAYNGSTIQVQGNSHIFSPVREYGVVSGTGKFRFATGYVTFETLLFDPSTAYALLRANITVSHY
ncbi:hypothetical protein REPUB_Repub13aG0183700 [Reevesia pubescens]